MTKEREFEGKTLEEAIEGAAAFLGVPEPTVVYRLLDEGRLGVFGLGARPARIAVEIPSVDAAEPVPTEPPPAPTARRERRPRAPRTPKPAAPAPTAEGAPPSAPPVALVESVGEILALGGFEIAARYEPAEAGWRILLDGPDREIFLKRDAELLGAFEFLLHRMGRRAWPDAGPLAVECDGRKSGREDDVAELAREVASVVARTGQARRLQPMNPYERRIVHVTVREFPGLVSRSEGQGFLKRVTVERSRKRAPRRDA